MSKFMQNLNGHLLCSIDTETTGLDPRKQDIVQIAILPLHTDLSISRDFRPFVAELVPRRPENVDSEAMRINRLKLCDIMTRGLDAYKAADLFVEWFERLNLGDRKRIVPLACNWPFDREFIIDWLGPATFNMCFDAQYRDVQTVASFLNDRAGWLGNDFPIPHVNLTYLCSQFRIERERAHDSVNDAKVTAEVYKRLIQEAI